MNGKRTHAGRVGLTGHQSRPQRAISTRHWRFKAIGAVIWTQMGQSAHVRSSPALRRYGGSKPRWSMRVSRPSRPAFFNSVTGDGERSSVSVATLSPTFSSPVSFSLSLLVNHENELIVIQVAIENRMEGLGFHVSANKSRHRLSFVCGGGSRRQDRWRPLWSGI